VEIRAFRRVFSKSSPRVKGQKFGHCIERKRERGRKGETFISVAVRCAGNARLPGRLDAPSGLFRFFSRSRRAENGRAFTRRKRARARDRGGRPAREGKHGGGRRREGVLARGFGGRGRSEDRVVKVWRRMAAGRTRVSCGASTRCRGNNR